MTGTITKFTTSTTNRNRIEEGASDHRERDTEECRVQQQPENGVDRELERVRGSWYQQAQHDARSDRCEIEGDLMTFPPGDEVAHVPSMSTHPVLHESPTPGPGS